MSHKAFRASLTLAAAGYIGSGDAAQSGDFPLGQRLSAAQAVPQADDVGFPFRQAGIHTPAHPLAGVPEIQLLQHVVVHLHHVDEGQGVAVPLRVQAVGQGQFSLGLPLGSEVHQDLVLNASGRIGGQAHLFLRIEGGHPLDQPDGSDGNQVVLVPVLGVILLGLVKQKESFSLSKTTP